MLTGHSADDAREQTHRGTGVSTVESRVTGLQSVSGTDDSDDVVAVVANRPELFHDLTRCRHVPTRRQTTNSALAVGQGAHHQGAVRRALVAWDPNLAAQRLEVFNSGVHCSCATWNPSADSASLNIWDCWASTASNRVPPVPSMPCAISMS